MKLSKKQWIKLIGFVVVSGATWLNPSAGFLIFLLKLCFHILEALQEKPQEGQPRRREKPGEDLQAD